MTPTQTIVAETLADASSTGVVVDHLLPKQASLAQLARNSRRVPDPSPSTKKSHRPTYVLPDSCKVTFDSQRFLYYDEPGEIDRLILFSTDKNLIIQCYDAYYTRERILHVSHLNHLNKIRANHILHNFPTFVISHQMSRDLCQKIRGRILWDPFIQFLQ